MSPGWNLHALSSEYVSSEYAAGMVAGKHNKMIDIQFPSTRGKLQRGRRQRLTRLRAVVKNHARAAVGAVVWMSLYLWVGMQMQTAHPPP